MYVDQLPHTPRVLIIFRVLAYSHWNAPLLINMCTVQRLFQQPMVTDSWFHSLNTLSMGNGVLCNIRIYLWSREGYKLLWRCTGPNMSPLPGPGWTDQRKMLTACRAETDNDPVSKLLLWPPSHGQWQRWWQKLIMQTTLYWTQVFKLRSYKEHCWTGQYGEPP